VLPHGFHLAQRLLHDLDHRRPGLVAVAALDRLGHLGVPLECLRLWEVRHEVVVVAAGEHLGHQLLQFGEHLVAGAHEHLRVELDVQPQEGRLVARLAGRPHPGGESDEVAGLGWGRPRRRERGRLRLDRGAQLGQRP